MARLEDHPGYLGLTSEGVILIHADWPIYPEEHGPDLALLWLTAFPPHTAFRCIDDIDRCILFQAEVKGSNLSKPFDSRNFHVAIWHADLLPLVEQEFVSGLSAATERRWEELRRSLMPERMFMVLGDGTRKPVHLPSIEDYDDEWSSWPEFAPDGVFVTNAGRSHATSLLSEGLTLRVFGERVEDMMRSGYFDAAVREACITLEHRMKLWLSSEGWGDALTEQFIVRLRSRATVPESYLRVLRGELRAAFKFIRNEFMHNFVGIDETQARAILFRLGRVISVVDECLAT
jgi:hypothetical protein